MAAGAVSDDHVAMMVDDRTAIQVSFAAQRVAVESFACAQGPGSTSAIERRRLAL